jgi:hypothetical protein
MKEYIYKAIQRGVVSSTKLSSWKPIEGHVLNFYYAHSSLKCTIEKIFGVCKNKWKLLHCMSNFPYDKQVKIVVAFMALHNFIRKHAIKDTKFQPYNDDDNLLLTNSISDNEEQDKSSIQQSDILNENSMNIECDHIANLLMTR